MLNYFTEKLTPEDNARLPYIPTINGLLEKAKNDYSQLPAVGNGTQTYTYCQFNDKIAMRRAFLYSKGLKDGAHVAVLARNSIDAMELFFAVTTAGCVLMMLPTALTGEKLAGIAAKFDIDAVIMEDEFSPLVTSALKAPVYPAGDAVGAAPAAAAEVTADTSAAIFFTGGTTGAPKGAVLSHGALMRGALNGTYHIGKVFGNRTIALLPLSHIFGSVMGFLSLIYTGGYIHACTDMKAGIMSIPVIKPDELIIVPGIVEIILNIASLKGAGFLGNLKTILCGAAPVPPRLMKEFKKYDITLLAGYGLTEGANLTAGNMDTDTRPDSMGKIYPEQEYKVVDGELWIRGVNIMKEYYKDPEKTAEVLTPDGWLKTGDLVRFDDEGYIYIVGRIKNLIILSNGENVSPEEIEEVFYKEPVVRDCLVREDSLDGRPVISVEILPVAEELAGLSEEEKKKKIDAAVASANSKLPSTHRVSKVMLRDTDFARTPAMKISRK